MIGIQMESYGWDMAEIQMGHDGMGHGNTDGVSRGR